MPFEIIPHVHIGDANDAIHLSANVGLVVNCTKHLPFYSPETLQVRIGVEDNGCEVDAIVEYWTDELFHAIANQINQGKDVLVHCQMGRQRSAATVAAFIMWALKWPLDRAVEHIRSKKREAFFPEINFIDPLRRFEQSKK